MCCLCGEEREYPHEFYGKRRQCKECIRAEAKAKRESWTPEQRAARRRSEQMYRERHRERARASNRATTERRRARMGAAEFKAYQAAATRRTLAKKRALVTAAKDHPCVDCGNRYPPRAMDLHHRDPVTKEYTVSQMLSKTDVEILDEIAKCIVLCAVCHRLRHGEALAC